MLVFGGMFCAISVMWTRNPVIYTTGVVLLFISMCFDLVDGWFANRFQIHSTMVHIADRIMDKIVYSIVFPLVAVGMMWRLHFILRTPTQTELLHAIFILLLCITVLVRDNFAHFMRLFTMRTGPEPESSEFTRLRTVVAAPVGAILYAHAFYVPEGPPLSIYFWISWLGNLPIRGLFFIEILFLIINFGSIAGYCRKYGTFFLDEICDEDEKLRRRILSFFPNSLTVMNAIMGLLAVFFAYQDRMRESYLFLVGAILFDKLDGALARKLGLTKPLPSQDSKSHITFGGIMDDIADAISFCIVPAWIFYIMLSDFQNPTIQWLPVKCVAYIYASLGICRLIYFTLDRNPIPGFFKGMPTPAAAALVMSPFIILSQAVDKASPSAEFWSIFSFYLIIFAAFLMNFYPIRYIHMGRFIDNNSWFGRINVLLFIIFIFTPYFGHFALSMMIFYLLSPLFTWRLMPKILKDSAIDDINKEEKTF